jgi:multisubunit Na+/H+ antiporter MnhB subunit
VLSKYPIFVFLLSGDTLNLWDLLLSMLFVYLCFTIYEVLHDQDLLPQYDADKALIIDISGLAIVSFLMAVELIGKAPIIGLFQGLIGLLNVIFVATYFGIQKMHFKSQTKGRMVFIGGFAVLINFSFGVRI